jgi:uncharacterized protein YbjT (DUF2867 family)
MKIVVIDGSGLIGTKVVKKLTERGHRALAASPNTGVDAATSRNLVEALRGGEIVVDASLLAKRPAGPLRKRGRTQRSLQIRRHPTSAR